MRAEVACAVVVAALAAGGCVEAFDGSNVQIDFNNGVQAVTRPGGVAQPDQPPANTHYELYAADLTYQRDEAGQPILDPAGQPVILQSFLFEVQRFTIRSAIDQSSPCFIDIEDTRFPGIHVTQFARELRASFGIAENEDPTASGALSRDQIVDVLTADRRRSNLAMIESQMKAVTSHADFTYPVADTVCADDPAAAELAIPPPVCTDPASNARRLALCRAAWRSNADIYEGSDKVFTLPLNGHFYGMVEGMNPINGGFVGGSGFFVPANLVGLEAYLLNWQYDDLDHDGVPDFPAALPDDQRSATGFPYMQGRPISITRGTVTVPLRHATNPGITATMAIFPNLGSDDVHF